MDDSDPQINAREARAGFRDLLDRAIAGERLVVTRHGKPVAVIVPHTWHENAKADIARIDRLNIMADTAPGDSYRPL